MPFKAIITAKNWIRRVKVKEKAVPLPDEVFALEPEVEIKPPRPGEIFPAMNGFVNPVFDGVQYQINNVAAQAPAYQMYAMPAGNINWGWEAPKPEPKLELSDDCIQKIAERLFLLMEERKLE